MDLTKNTLLLLDENGRLDRDSLYREINDLRTMDRISFLCQSGYFEQVGNQIMLTDRGKEVIKKMP